MFARILRRIAVVGAIAASTNFAAGYGRFAASITLISGLLVVGAVVVWLPRAGHRAFARGDFGRSVLYYRLLGLFSVDRGARASIAVSVAACDLARARYAAALERLDSVDADVLTEAARTAWLNNRAYALARQGDDAAAALAASDQAVALRPGVPGFRHTRGIALLALGRIDEAIGTLNSVWDARGGEEIPPLLEAERCFDLGTAWLSKGEREYARDYFERAQRAAPASIWASQAAGSLGAAPTRPSSVALPELV